MIGGREEGRPKKKTSLGPNVKIFFQEPPKQFFSGGNHPKTLNPKP